MAAPNPAKSGHNSSRSRTGAGLPIKGRMPDLPEPEPKSGKSLLIISRWIMLWNKAVFCLEVLIYKRLQMWRHNNVIGRNEYLICISSESTVP